MFHSQLQPSPVGCSSNPVMVPIHAKDWSSLACPQTWPTQILVSAMPLSDLIIPHLFCSQSELWPSRGVLQVPLLGLLPALNLKICHSPAWHGRPWSWPLHISVGPASWPYSVFELQPPWVSGGFLVYFPLCQQKFIYGFLNCCMLNLCTMFKQSRLFLE